MRKTFYFIRHGQTDLNLRGIVQGRGVDSPLNEMGHKQAQAFYEAFHHVPFDKIYTSTLLRTKQTVRLFLKQGIPSEELSGLDEISWGIYEGKEQDETIITGFEEVVSSWRDGNLDLSIEQGESPNQLVARQQQAISYMLQQHNEERVLVCMHGRAMRIMLCHLTGVPVCLMDDFPHTNTALYVLEYNGSDFTIVDHYNVKHLENI
ncbi:histidine phosphatase family protein [Sphingobacterium sp. DN00404]|uniref:Histidine phosphatase family protein n=1 Tax=Sphingobacterium micropteri TaxID=2763501 RepID=A0ABR7YQQ3_9SPHI|nr:histidine phosphatase family protein [Sphingobacterium micropteri]MBD1433657.1 histidine phosphatase family protein [Sphingobacterium micropteri]